MNVEEFRNYCLSKKGATESFPFDQHTLVFKVMGKMFALCALERIPTQVNLKCDPDRSVELRSTYDGRIIKGYHMSGLHWNTLLIEDNIPHTLLLELIDHSYELVVDKLTKKLKAELDKLV